jgi:hypothetical protein
MSTGDARSSRSRGHHSQAAARQNGTAAFGMERVAAVPFSYVAAEEAGHACAAVAHGWEVARIDVIPTGRQGGHCFSRARQAADPLLLAIEDLTITHAGRLAADAYGPPQHLRPIDADAVELAVKLSQNGDVASGWAAYTGGDDDTDLLRVAEKVTSTPAEGRALIAWTSERARNLVADSAFRSKTMFLATVLERERVLEGDDLAHWLSRAEFA